MSFPKPVTPVLFFLAVTENKSGYFLEHKSVFEEELGMLLLQSHTYDFSLYTDYYKEEMGQPLWKTFFFFEFLKDPSYLIDLKHLCYNFERRWAEPSGKRRVNLDPGYLSLSKVVLSTFKDYAHRIYLGNAVYGEVTLIFREGTFYPLPWTYPDYKEEKVLNLFNKVRSILKERLRASR